MNTLKTDREIIEPKIKKSLPCFNRKQLLNLTDVSFCLKHPTKDIRWVLKFFDKINFILGRSDLVFLKHILYVRDRLMNNKTLSSAEKPYVSRLETLGLIPKGMFDVYKKEKEIEKIYVYKGKVLLQDPKIKKYIRRDIKVFNVHYQHDVWKFKERTKEELRSFLKHLV